MHPPWCSGAGKLGLQLPDVVLNAVGPFAAASLRRRAARPFVLNHDEVPTDALHEMIN